jgi:hypothetical protein
MVVTFFTIKLHLQVKGNNTIKKILLSIFSNFTHGNKYFDFQIPYLVENKVLAFIMPVSLKPITQLQWFIFCP